MGLSWVGYLEDEVFGTGSSQEVFHRKEVFPEQMMVDEVVCAVLEESGLDAIWTCCKYLWLA